METNHVLSPKCSSTFTEARTQKKEKETIHTTAKNMKQNNNNCKQKQEKTDAYNKSRMLSYTYGQNKTSTLPLD